MSVCVLLVVALFSSTFVHADNQSSTILPGSFLTAALLGRQQPLLISSGNQFAFGFCSPSNQSTGEIYVAVWYANLDNAVVWLANRDSPAPSTAALNFSERGDLVLLDNHGKSIWSTGTDGQGVVRAQIEDSGDFVLLNGSGSPIWHSFENPTDTILPGQQLTTEVQLFSRKTAVSFASGIYSLDFSTLGMVELKYTQKTTFPYSTDALGFPAYWSVGSGVKQSAKNASSGSQVAGEFSLSGVLSFYNTSGETYASYLPADVNAIGSIIRKVTLDVDGNLRVYSWDESSSSWIIAWRAVYQSCSTIQGLCGPYGVCINNPETACICPAGFDVVDSNDLSQGCAPHLPIQDLCSSTKFVPLDDTDYYFNNLLVTTGMSAAQCVQSCSNSCACVAVLYSIAGNGQCWQKSTVVLNGYSPTWNDVSAFIKVSNSSPVGFSPDQLVMGTNRMSAASWEPQPSSSIVPSSSPFLAPSASFVPGKNSTDKSILIITFVTLGELVCFSVAGWFVLRKKPAGKVLRERELQRPTAALGLIAGGPTVFSYQDLESATNNFSEKLGSGGFGTVYKGQLANGQIVAVKKLDATTMREGQFRAEMASMSVAHHINLVRLYGFCAEQDHRLLVYEYLENGSLDSFLFRDSGNETITKPTLNWKARFDICLGTARAIAYLHEDCPKCILHCDIKPQNVLLDENLCPKVADFGISYSLSRQYTLQVSRIRGTRGYLAPEWLSHLAITAKADVFSFGMLLLEIVSGRNNYKFSASAGDVFTSSSSISVAPETCFPVWAFEKVREGNLLEVVDEHIMGSMEWEQVETVLRVAFWCIQTNMAARPTMREVLKMLRGGMTIADPPPPLQ